MNEQGRRQLELRMFVGCICALGVMCIGFGMIPWRSTDVVQFLCYLALSALASGWKVRLPGFEATLSVSLILFIVAIGSMSLSETLALGVAAAAVQYCWRKKTSKFSPLQGLFNVSQICIALTAAHSSYAYLTRTLLQKHALIALLAASIIYFLLNSLPVCFVVSLAERVPVSSKWKECAWMFPYYLVGAAVGAVIQVLNRYAGWEIAILVMPAVYILYRSYSLHIGRLEDTQAHLTQMASVHLRTVEALALAIDAKDHTTGDHVNRVRVYALEIAKDLNATPDEMDALRAAAVLHDIGKLAVPEHIISKPGKLTPDEFDKMKVHPIVGAEILEQVDFPYPVVPIVRSHHEKWNGTGYPDGLAGEAIPLGARILSAVDCLDALASDRQYRRALPLDEAMARVEQESGKTFDPRVVAALKARYRELEKLAKSQEKLDKPKLSVDVKVTRGGAPAAGYAEPARQNEAAVGMASVNVLDAACVADGADDLLPAVAMRLRHEIPFDAIAVFTVEESYLVPSFAFGQECGTLLRSRFRVGEGLLGWVAATRQRIVNGNPAVDAQGPRRMSSALAAPIEYMGTVVGVAVLYHRSPDAFCSRELEALLRHADEIRLALTPTSPAAVVPGATPALAMANAAGSFLARSV
jgi:putative nucleotidyltransferase with HDIG domain